MLYMRISTQNIACSQRQMNTCHTSFSYILWAYGEHIMSKWSSRTSDQFIWLVSEKKTEAVKAYLIKNSKGEEEERERERGVGVGGKHSYTPITPPYFPINRDRWESKKRKPTPATKTFVKNPRLQSRWLDNTIYCVYGPSIYSKVFRHWSWAVLAFNINSITSFDR